MARVQQIEAAAREADALAGSMRRANPLVHLLVRKQL
jgi:hypothetical protein